MPRAWSAESRRFWSTLPAPARALFQAAVFFTFSSLGFAVDLLAQGRYSTWGLLLLVVTSGAIALGWVKAVQDWRYLPLPIALQLGIVFGLPRMAPLAPSPLTPAALTARVQLDAMGLLFVVMAGYSLFVAFIGRQGVRHLRLRTELDLARQIHDALVPPLHQRWEGYEVVGRSLPASEVGGDLLDAVATGMVKSAARMRLRGGGGLEGLMSDLNEVLLPLKRPNMFVTCACLRLTPQGEAEYVRAGHPPLLHFVHASGQVVRYAEGELPLGVRAGEVFRARPFRMATGDVLAMITDGLTEVTNRDGREFGLEGVERLLAAQAGLPLPGLFESLLDAIRAHGPQQDDQTLLLIRAH